MMRRPVTESEARRPRITFGMIVLNGEPYLEYNLRALYPFAHEIIVVEGAYWAAKGHATPDGHSTDNTLDVLRRFKAEHDQRDIVQIVTREGFWDGLTAQSQAYAERATGDYLWQVDVDEFYLPQTMQAVVDLLTDDPSITMMTFKAVNFMYDVDYRVVSGRDFQRDYIEYRRLFKFGPGYHYVGHEPPTVHDPEGQDVETIHCLSKNATAHRGWFMHHYWALLESTVRMKADAYVQREWKGVSEAMPSWLANWRTLSDPFRLQSDYRYAAWLERFAGPHPPEIVRLRNDLASGRIDAVLPSNAAVERLLASRGYRVKRWFVRLWERLRGWDSYLRVYLAYRPIRACAGSFVRVARWLKRRTKRRS